ncbi:MAG TPA: DUF6515 family protein [Mucilaginibacter sp.]
MKKTYKYLVTLAVNGLLCSFIALSADAQHRDGGGGSSSSGGSRSSGSSGGGSSFRPSASSSGNSGFRPSNGGFVQRPSNGGFRPSVSGVNRPSVGYRPSGVGYARPGVNPNSRVAIAPQRFANPGYGITAPTHRVGIVNPGVTAYGGATTARSYVGTRGYIGEGGRASVGVGGHGFYGPSYWRTRGYYHYNHGYYGTYYAPRLGFSIGFLPYGYYPFYYDDAEFFYSGGLFYQYDNNEYTVVEPPVGAEVTSLPSNAQSIMINGEQYYEANGVYYQPITKDDGSTSYQIAGKDGELNTNNPNGDMDQQMPQIGDIVQALPPNCRKISLNGEKYYVSEDGYYYQEARDNNNQKVYKIVGTPDDGPSDQQ